MLKTKIDSHGFKRLDAPGTFLNSRRRNLKAKSETTSPGGSPHCFTPGRVSDPLRLCSFQDVILEHF